MTLTQMLEKLKKYGGIITTINGKEYGIIKGYPLVIDNEFIVFTYTNHLEEIEETYIRTEHISSVELDGYKND